MTMNHHPRMVPRILFIRLPFRRPPHQLVPIFTLMFRPKSLDTSNLVIFDFDRCIRLAHERVSQQIDTVTDMGRRGHHR